METEPSSQAVITRAEDDTRAGGYHASRQWLYDAAGRGAVVLVAEDADGHGGLQRERCRGVIGRIETPTGEWVATVSGEGTVHGSTGEHLGWMVDGVLYDVEGYPAGYSARRCPAAVLSGLPTSSGHLARADALDGDAGGRARGPVPLRPPLQVSASPTLLAEYFTSGLPSAGDGP